MTANCTALYFSMELNSLLGNIFICTNGISLWVSANRLKMDNGKKNTLKFGTDIRLKSEYTNSIKLVTV